VSGAPSPRPRPPATPRNRPIPARDRRPGAPGASRTHDLLAGRPGLRPGPAARQGLAGRAPAGITVEELLQRVAWPTTTTLAPQELERWLVHAGFATKHAGLLSPTESAVAIAVAFE
jgi:hypothetical protein